MTDLVVLALVVVVGWVAASVIGSIAYFQGDQNK